MGSILVVDDDAQLRLSFERLLTAEGHSVRTAATGEAGVQAVSELPPDLVIMDVRLPGMNGLAAFQAIHELESQLPVIVMTAYGTTDTAIEATKSGAFDFVLKPFDVPEMLQLIAKALETGRLMHERDTSVPPKEIGTHAVMLGESKAMQLVYKAIGRVAHTDATVLIRGESGTGKELVAQAIWRHSLRSEKPLNVINCVAIPETLLESELFGYEKGAFTGATSRKTGKIEQAHGGTVFFDEIGDMPVSIQAKILRLLQEKIIERLGGRAPIGVDVRVIAATNRDLETAQIEGHFREDLYYRLKVVTIDLPPLRERKGDIEVLAKHFLARYAGEMEIPYPGFSAEAGMAMNAYFWPGNVRELANAVQKALIFSRGGPISAEEISQVLSSQKNRTNSGPYHADETVRGWVGRALSSGGGERTFADLTDRFAAIVIAEALNLTGGNRSQAARLLGLSRPTLLAKIDKYGITVQTAAVRDE